MKLIVNGFLACLLALSATVGISSVAFSPDATAYNDPEALMTIRFNQKIVSYQDQLFYVVSEAVKTKPTVVFEVVAVSPNGVSHQGQQVANDIIRIGVNPQQVRFRAEPGSVNSEEVRIFVR